MQVIFTSSQSQIICLWQIYTATCWPCESKHLIYSMSISPAPETHAALKQRITVLEEENTQLASKIRKTPWVLDTETDLFSHISLSTASIPMCMRGEEFAGLSALWIQWPIWLLSMTGVLCWQMTSITLNLWPHPMSKCIVTFLVRKSTNFMYQGNSTPSAHIRSLYNGVHWSRS